MEFKKYFSYVFSAKKWQGRTGGPYPDPWAKDADGQRVRKSTRTVYSRRHAKDCTYKVFPCWCEVVGYTKAPYTVKKISGDEDSCWGVFIEGDLDWEAGSLDEALDFLNVPKEERP